MVLPATPLSAFLLCGLLLGGACVSCFRRCRMTLRLSKGQFIDLQQQVAKSLQQKKIYEQMKADSVELAAEAGRTKDGPAARQKKRTRSSRLSNWKQPVQASIFYVSVFVR